MPRTGTPRLIMELCKRIHSDYITSKEADTRLPRDTDLAQQYNASRGSIRAALCELERTRSIYRKANRGAYVARTWPVERIKHVGKQIAILHFRNSPSSPLRDSFNVQAISGIKTAINPLGLNSLLVMHTTYSMTHNQETLADHISNDFIKGAILGSQPSIILDQIPTLTIPICALDWDGSALHIDSACFNNREAGAATIRRLARLGHRRIVLIGESPSKEKGQCDTAWQERQQGMLKALKESIGITYDEIYNQTRDALLKEAGDALLHLLNKPAHLRPTAIVIPSCERLPQWKEFANKAGLSIPKDLSIMGFGGVQEFKMSGHEFDAQNLGYAAGFHLTTLLHESKQPNQCPKRITVKGLYRAGNSLAHAPKNS